MCFLVLAVVLASTIAGTAVFITGAAKPFV